METRAARTFMLVMFVVMVQGFQVTEGNLLKAVTPIAAAAPIKCENGGLPDGIKCICPGNGVYGVRCELVRDRVLLGRSLDTTIIVELPVNGSAFTNDLNDASSPSRKLLNNSLTELEKSILPGYFQGIKITEVQNAPNGIIVVIHDVIIRISFNKTQPVADQYEKNYKEVEKILNTEKCQDGGGPLCIKGLRAITPHIPPTEKELCVRNISALFVNYFDAVVEDDGLSCVSQCDLVSPRYVNCTVGTCQIKTDGAECFCPNTEKYLYTYSGCRGAVLIVAMYGGVGAAVAVLVITSVILGVFFYRKKYYY
ncbi:mucin-17-like isoform X2 [Lithobates pipiens]